MAVLSVCRNFAPLVARAGRNQLGQQIRHGGHGNSMTILPSNWQWMKFKDMLHLYTMIGFIPCFLFASYKNLFEGLAELAEIPEGYTPKWHEYERHPVSRWLCRTVIRDPAVLYEMRLSVLNMEADAVIMRRIDEQICNVMKARHDYRAWFFWPFYGKHQRHYREIYRMWEDRTGVKDPIPLHPSGGLAEYKNPMD